MDLENDVGEYDDMVCLHHVEPILRENGLYCIRVTADIGIDLLCARLGECLDRETFIVIVHIHGQKAADIRVVRGTDSWISVLSLEHGLRAPVVSRKHATAGDEIVRLWFFFLTEEDDLVTEPAELPDEIVHEDVASRTAEKGIRESRIFSIFKRPHSLLCLGYYKSQTILHQRKRHPFCIRQMPPVPRETGFREYPSGGGGLSCDLLFI